MLECYCSTSLKFFLDVRVSKGRVYITTGGSRRAYVYSSLRYNFNSSILRGMKLTPHEIEKIKLHNAGFIAQKRLAKGIRLNVIFVRFPILLCFDNFIHTGPRSDRFISDTNNGICTRRNDCCRAYGQRKAVVGFPTGLFINLSK